MKAVNPFENLNKPPINPELRIIVAAIFAQKDGDLEKALELADELIATANSYPPNTLQTRDKK